MGVQHEHPGPSQIPHSINPSDPPSYTIVGIPPPRQRDNGNFFGLTILPLAEGIRIVSHLGYSSARMWLSSPYLNGAPIWMQVAHQRSGLASTPWESPSLSRETCFVLESCQTPKPTASVHSGGTL
ncbi:hypothetical protein DL768_009837 [Monosporascus sp. mg162]|nr:hypothetical protein DL768_009837 [Monosporascus sp. mg162]